jgi:predicted kinase
MPKLIYTKGLPASGKSTWAKAQQAKDPNTVRVNKDDLRAMLHNSKWSSKNEKQVLRIRDEVIMDSLLQRSMLSVFMKLLTLISL